MKCFVCLGKKTICMQEGDIIKCFTCGGTGEIDDSIVFLRLRQRIEFLEGAVKRLSDVSEATVKSMHKMLECIKRVEDIATR